MWLQPAVQLHLSLPGRYPRPIPHIQTTLCQCQNESQQPQQPVDQTTLRTTALALSYSAAEYACTVWLQSRHATQVGVVLNETARTVIGCLRPTPLNKVRKLAGIAPPEIRRKVASRAERKKVDEDPRQPLQKNTPASSRLGSRKSFMRTSQAITATPPLERVSLWSAECGDNEIKEKLPLAKIYHGLSGVL